MANMYGNFVWWQGVVEDKMDPLMLGRCRVRILGYHTDDKHEIPTKDLPWATIMQPTTSAAISGIGTTPLGPVEGTWVIGFFRDGEDAQEPIIMGTIGGIPQEGANPQKGFNDPYGRYPKDDYLANPDYELRDGSVEPKAAEPDTNRLARGNFVIPTKDLSVITNDGVPLSNGENSTSLIWKRAARQEGVPKALAGNLSSSVDDTNEKFYATNTGGTTTNLEDNLDDASVSGFNITNAGSGYESATVTITGSATATAKITDGVVSSIEIDDFGFGYTETPTVTISAPSEEGGTQATATANIIGFDTSGIPIDVDPEDVDPTVETINDPNYYWNEPLPRYGGVKKSVTEFATKNSSCYPYNHVRQSESGHVEEWDDTPTVERLHRFHKAGTFEEIQADGTRVVKVVGDDYEIVAGDKNILISKREDIDEFGNLSITVEGDCRLLTVGSLVQEVRGNYHLNVHGDMRTKITGNDIKEVMTARKVKVEQDDDLKVGRNKVVNVGVDAKYQIGNDFNIIAGSSLSTTSGAGTSLIANSEMFVKGRLAIDLSGGVIAGLGAPVTNITGTALVNITSPVGVINVLAPVINIIAKAIINNAAPIIDILGGGMVNIGTPDLNEFSVAHVVVTGLYTAHAGLITLN